MTARDTMCEAQKRSTGVDWSRLESTGVERRRSAARAKPAFALIELLAVVMLLTVLMMAAFPAFRGLQRANHRHRAVAESDAIAQAAIAYRRTYGQWPLEPQARGLQDGDTAIVAGRDVRPQHLELSNVVAVLRGVNTNANPRRTIFLELPDDRLDFDGTPLDPWRQPYVLTMTRVGYSDSEGDVVARQEGGVSVEVALRNGSTNAVVDGPDDAAAFSWGDPAHSDRDVPREIFSWSKR